MKLPQALASTPAAGSIPYGVQSLENPIAQTLQRAGAAGIVEAQGWNEVENRLDAARKAVESTKILSDLEAEAKLAGENPPTNLHPSLWRKQMTEQLTKQLESRLAPFAKDEAWTNTTRARGLAAISDYGVAFHLKATHKQIESMTADYLAQQKDFERAIINALTPEAAAKKQKEWEDFTATLTAAGVFKEDAAQKHLQTFLNTVDHGRALQALEADPEAFSRAIVNPKAFPGLTEEQRYTLGKQALVVIQHRAVEEERQEKKAAARLKDDWHANESSIRYKILQGDSDALVQLQRQGWSAGNLRTISPEGEKDLLDFYNTWRKEKLVEVSDRATAMNARIRVRRIGVTEADRSWLVEQLKVGLLSGEDFDKLDNEAQANIQKGKDESKATLRDEHTQAEQLLQARLGITGFMDSLTQMQKRVYGEALDELTARSQYHDGTERPLSVVREIAPRYQSLIREDAQLSIDQKKRLLKYATPQELEAARPRLSKPYYESQRRLMLEVMSDEQQAFPEGRLNQAVKPKGVGQKPTTPPEPSMTVIPGSLKGQNPKWGR